MNILAIVCVLVSYFIGAIPFGILVSRGSGIDIRTQGSKNIGATNVTRLLGKKMGVLTLIFDMLKGFLPMFIAAAVVKDHPNQHIIIALCGAASVLGHMFPVYLGFKGGKGVATALGAFFYLAPAAVLFSLVVFLAAVGFSGFVSLGSLLGSAAVIPCLFFLGQPGWKMYLAIFIVIFIWLKHAENISRLLSGTEKSWKKKPGTLNEP